MAVLPTTYGSLLDIAKSLDPDGNTADIVDILSLEVPIIEHMEWKQGNMPDGHLDVIRTGLPEGTWRQLYGFVNPSKDTTAQVKETTGMLEAYAVVDKALIELSGDAGKAYRFQQDKAHIKGLGHDVAKVIAYGNEATLPASFTGLSPRYNSKSAPNADNVIDAGGTGSDNTSIWIINWGDDTVCGIYPKNTMAGLQQRDLGEFTETNAAGGKRQVMQSHYKWFCGITVSDWRHAVRICNIDVSDLSADGSTGAKLINLLIEGVNRLPSIGPKAHVYANRTILTALHQQIVNKANVNLTLDTAGGKKVMHFNGLPAYRWDSLVNNEARVT